MKCLSINVPLDEALKQIPGYAKFMKELVTTKQSINFETIKVTRQVSAIVHSIAPKLEYPSAFMISCISGSAEFAKALCDLRASINLIPCSVFKTLGIWQPRPTSMRLQMDDRTMNRPLGVIEDVLLRVDKFILPEDFVILYCRVYYDVPIILGIPFLDTEKALCVVEGGELTFRVGYENLVFHVCKSMRQPNSNEVCSFVDLVTNVIVDDTSVMINVGDMLEAVFLNFNDDYMDGFMECMNSLQVMGSYNYAPQKLSLDLESRTTPPTKPSIEEPPTLELKPLSPHHRYEFLGPCSTLPVILSSCLTNVQINLEEGAKPSIEHQRRLNEAMQEVVKKEIIKWLDAGVIYSISDSSSMFQRFMMAIFTDMVEDYLEVFMDDFSVVVDSFDVCLENLDRVLVRCEETNLVLNWEKCHFIVEEGIVFDYKISKNGIEVGKCQSQYTVMGKELIAIMFAIGKLRPYLMGAKIIIHADHAALCYLISKKDSKAQLVRCVLLLQEYNIDIQYEKGTGGPLFSFGGRGEAA
ncbi:uncharacterized protein [Nicotiana tomentosiformis]|uniref:uncharacterized protein n=1 Tax=Nicotiana tomentosiformis TaxID=4098 RepID=UPI00388CE7AC